MMQDIFAFALFPGLPLAALIRGSIALFRRDRWRVFLGLNLGALILLGIAALFVEGDPNGPVPDLALVLFVFGYLPAHLLLMAAIYGIYWFLRRRRSRNR